MTKRLPIEHKILLVKRVLAGERIASVCRENNISRTIFYRWLKIYKNAHTKAKPKVLCSRMVNGEKHWKRFPRSTERQIIKIAISNPDCSTHSISQIVKVSNNGVWRVLKRNNLNTREDRLRYVNVYGNSLVKSYSDSDKLTMLRRFEAGEKVSHLCREFGISRTLFYRWLSRYKISRNLDSLQNARPNGERHWKYDPVAKKLNPVIR